MGVTETALTRQLESRMPDLYRRYQEAVALWPEPVDDISGFEYRHEHGDAAVTVNDRLGNLRTRPGGDLCRVVIASSNLLEGSGSARQLKFPALLEHWVAHLAGNIRYDAFHTLMIAKEEKRVVNLLPLDTDQAREYLAGILGYWIQGQTRPLPIESGAAFGYLRGLYPARGEGSEDKALLKATDAYGKALERDSGYLRRAYPEVEQLLENDEFPLLVSALYEPLWHAEQAGRAKPSSAGRERAK
jgi:exodeoxyribonuclease V gamma subunit